MFERLKENLKKSKTQRIDELFEENEKLRAEIERQRALIEGADALICHLRYMADKEGSLIKKIDAWLKDARVEAKHETT